MKIFYLIVLIKLLVFSNSAVFAQTKVDTARLSFIRTQYAHINDNLKLYKKKTIEDTAKTTEGNEVVRFYKGPEIKKIKAMYYGETGKALDEYYFYNGKLIFYFKAEYHYNMPINVNGSKITSVKETRYYFNDDQLVKVLPNPTKSLSTTALAKLSAETRREAGRLMKLN
ncbi:hypothetical protein HDF24_07275 [Mucilaginibacter sp. X4EP1]|uniref:hypothetical protein n=1 Tax=Mucilaginibacter sp. X4EP1 TaxID=2723092 RepID=UPI00216901FE|nr:hypothetical protein [Mucilaginibacter sp. X4EP1]MCS3814111.1 hypothetical protein [Mucilaginibacter sp. X4EP1]